MYPGWWPTENTVDIPIRACFLQEMGITPKFQRVDSEHNMSQKSLRTPQEACGTLMTPDIQSA